MGADFEKMRGRSVLILGGGGFIGTNLAEHLAGTQCSVTCVSRSTPHPEKQKVDGITYFAADLADADSYAGLLEKVDYVIYLASATTPSTSIANPELEVEANLLPFLNFLRLNATHQLPVVFASSGGTVYGPPRYLPVDEAHPTEPISPYGIAKLSMEKYLSYFGKRYGFRYTVLRISNPYGGRHHRRSDQGVIDVFSKKIVNGEELVIWGSGSVVRDYVHISDVCRSFLCAMLYTGTSTVFNIGAGEGRSIMDIVDALGAHSDRSPRLRFEEGRSYDIATNVLDISLAGSELGWRPVSNFNAGLAETLRNVK